ncbi:putative phospholipid-transporting P-type ATPase [Histomonas meleagridis]|uniref:putative phospholipid-transporting P-type ATPase n=1 Tax=Histomonas meleagridis TaxID=135588 RepID=UPI00355A073F|nr:putative phospholipid-transporting P-type ATPase [Histomonas meleagridis]KAH0805836.1 putative phospholipid-transporting P-type ATPase [Histomonas meleagridis]
MWDEYQTYKRDIELNSKEYTVITPQGPKRIKSEELLVGHIIEVEAGERVPADLILLKTTEEVGSAFIKTDQLDGETDWKLRRSLGFSQSCDDLFSITDITFEIEPPQSNIYEFSGRVLHNNEYQPIGPESTVWCNCVVSSGKITGIVAYTSTETRSSLNAAPPSIKMGRFEKEMNRYSTVLFSLLFIASFIAAGINGITSNFPVLLVRFVLLFSYIIPISMRVNLDLSRLIFAHRISHDENIKGAILRNSSLPEELGRVQFLFTDKTGTLTQNEMEFKKLQYDNYICESNSLTPPHPMSFLALSLCHCVSVTEEGFQASSPDEIALVKQASRIGLKLVNRTDDFIDVEINGIIEKFEILATLPFSSVWSHMGIVLSNTKYGKFILIKGSDTSVSKMCPPSEWLDEVVGNLAREGLRTLVFAYKGLNDDELNSFLSEFHTASNSITNRSEMILQSFQHISNNMELLGVTGVEDKLQDKVQETFEALEAAQIKIWMLTGDKMETAICIALSSRLFSYDSDYKVINSLSELVDLIDSQYIPPLVINGNALQSTTKLPDFFINVVIQSPAVIVFRCSPSQKEKVVKSVMEYKDITACAIGDGGNDVSMIQASSIGIGIVGKEGKQASLSADVSINSFSQLQNLLFWHGSSCYKHSSRLAQFVMHRGVIMTVTQAIYSLIYNFVPTKLYNDWLNMGFATFFTSLPVFSLIFDTFVDLSTVMEFPELYVKCQKGRYFSPKTFMQWIWLAIYQGSVIIYTTINVYGFQGIDERHMQSIAFTAMILTELVLIAIELNRFTLTSVVAEILSFLMYFITIFLLPEAFDIYFMFTKEFIVKTLFLTIICILPLLISQFYQKRFNPTHEVSLQISDGMRKSGFFNLK